MLFPFRGRQSPFTSFSDVKGDLGKWPDFDCMHKLSIIDILFMYLDSGDPEFPDSG